MGGNTKQFNEQNFENEVLKADIPVLVDFWAEWCGPCRMLGPVVDELADEYAGRVKVGKVNVDECQNIAVKYGIMSIPTLIVFNRGEEAGRSLGVVSMDELAELVESQL